jgi:phosphoglycolate phosphatase-like HAD superfamily hydrolase
MMPAVLFDVDGTLVKGQGAGRMALSRGLEQVLGVPSERALDVTARIDYRGSTDQKILEQIFALLELSDEGGRSSVIEAYVGHLPACIEESGMALLPGAAELVDRLRTAGVRVGLLTGNVRAAARLKVAPFGLAELADAPGGFGDDGRERADIARIARDRLATSGGPPRPLVVVGDTEWDVSAARAVGATAVAVETGWTGRDALIAAKPDLLLPDLQDPSGLLALLDPAQPGRAEH